MALSRWNSLLGLLFFSKSVDLGSENDAVALDSAIEFYAIALSHAPKGSVEKSLAHYWLGKLCDTLGDHESALENFKSVRVDHLPILIKDRNRQRKMQESIDELARKVGASGEVKGRGRIPVFEV